MTKIATIQNGSGRYFFLNDFLGEHYASWTVCAKTCIVRLYNIDTLSTTKVPSTSDNKPQYASTIDETSGVMFFVRSGCGCGVGVKVWSASLARLSAPTKIGSIRTGQDIANTMSLDAGDLVFSKYSCSDGVGIYSLPGADT